MLRARGSTYRSCATPLGRETYASVRTANYMVGRCMILILLAAARGIWVVLEQPKGSLMEHHPAFEYVMTKIVRWRKFIEMGRFGAETAKGTWLYSSGGPRKSSFSAINTESHVHCVVSSWFP